MRKLLALTIASLALAVPAAAKNVSGGSLDIQPGSVLALGGAVKFDAVYNYKFIDFPRIQVLCSQDGVLVYGEAGPVGHEFILGGASSDWLRAGGPADCHADLFHFLGPGGQDWNGRTDQGGVEILDSLDFPASG